MEEGAEKGRRVEKKGKEEVLSTALRLILLRTRVTTEDVAAKGNPKAVISANGKSSDAKILSDMFHS